MPPNVSLLYLKKHHRLHRGAKLQMLIGAHRSLLAASSHLKHKPLFSRITRISLKGDFKGKGMLRNSRLFRRYLRALVPKEYGDFRGVLVRNDLFATRNYSHGIQNRNSLKVYSSDGPERRVTKNGERYQRLNWPCPPLYRRNDQYRNVAHCMNVTRCILCVLLALVIQSTAYDEVPNLRSIETPYASVDGAADAETGMLGWPRLQQHYNMRGSKHAYMPPDSLHTYDSAYSFRGTGVGTRRLQVYNDNPAMQMYLLQQHQQRRRVQQQNISPGSPSAQQISGHYSQHEVAPSYAHQYGATQWPPHLQQQSPGYNHQYDHPNYAHHATYASQIQQPQQEWQQQQWQLWQQQQQQQPHPHPHQQQQQQQRGPWDAQQWQQYQQHYMQQQALQQQAAWQAHVARNPYLHYRSNPSGAVPSTVSSADPTGAGVSPAAAILVQSLRGMLGDLAGPATGQSIESLTSLVLQHLPPQQQRQIYQQLQQMLNGQQHVPETVDLQGSPLQSTSQHLTAQEATDLSRAAELMAAGSKAVLADSDSENSGVRAEELLGQAAPVPCLPRKCLEGLANTIAPVCGSDGKTYMNECKLIAVACASPQKSLTVSREGPCTVGDADSAKAKRTTERPPTDPAEKAVSAARLSVDEGGSALPKEVKKGLASATPSISLPSKLATQQEAQGNPTEQTAVPTSQQLLRKARPLCRINCPAGGVRVCGSDGQTYVNACELEAYACLQQKQIQVKHSGPCQRSAAPTENEGGTSVHSSEASPEAEKE